MEEIDFSLMSWNILAPCWVQKDWYPSVYHLASDHEKRLNLIFDNIIALNCDLIFLQETQADLLSLFQEKFGEKYLFEYAPNNPTSASLSNGLLVLIKTDWIYTKEMKIFNGILDPIKGEAIQFLHIPSKNLFFINVHLDYLDSLSQLNLIKKKFGQLFNQSTVVSLLAGDFNRNMSDCDQFPSNEYGYVFDQTVPTYYPDPATKQSNSSIDQIIYHKRRLKLLESGQAFQTKDQSLEDALRLFGSDHIFIWAKFQFT